MADRLAIAVVGPTCAGKTKIAIELAKLANGEIISADARQIYRVLNVGTAKPSLEERAEVPHHLVDILSPEDEVSAGVYAKLAWDAARDIFSRNLTPIIVGGSGLYVRAIVDGLFDAPEVGREIKTRLRNRLHTETPQALLDELKHVDPEAAEGLLPQNYKRIIRALEVYHASGRKISEMRTDSPIRPDFKTIQFGILVDRTTLYRRIEARVDDMITSGLLDEVKEILRKGFDPELNSLQTVGYKEAIRYLQGNIRYEDMVDLIKMNTRRYAKRQMTWFRKDKRIIWIESTGRDPVSVAKEIVSSYSAE
ncbi:MAG TPA: tRNA (adenosine(37)-N6)-dimethylallyltransferase MiaA [Candidatus Kryptonia bacterium]